MQRWWIWTIFVVLWTIALEMPVPEPTVIPGGEVLVTRKKLFAKTAHVIVYAGFTVLSAWVPLAPRYRWLMILFVMAHATATELMQEALYEWCHRGGALEDVAFDQLGILIGVALSWKWWMRESESTP